MAPALLHAAAFNKNISRIAFIEPFSSYRSIVMSRLYNQQFINGAVGGSLKAYDLPDLAASLVPRKLLMIGVTDGNGERKDEGMFKDIDIINSYYQQNNASKELLILTETVSTQTLNKTLSDWIK